MYKKIFDYKNDKKSLSNTFYSDYYYNNNSSYSSFLSTSFKKSQYSLIQNKIPLKSKYFKTIFKQSIYDGVKINRVSSVKNLKNNFIKVKSYIRLQKKYENQPLKKSIVNDNINKDGFSFFLTVEKEDNQKNKIMNEIKTKNKIKNLNDNINNLSLNKKNKEFEKNKSHSKLEYKINKMLYSNRIVSNRDLIKKCHDKFLLKIIQSLQKDKIKYFSRDLKGETERLIKNIKLDIKKIIKDKKKYNNDMELYLNFLAKEKMKNYFEIEFLKDKKYELLIEVKDITLEIIRKQKELKKAIKLRNFLLKVKEKIKSLPNEFIELNQKESKKEFITNEINSLNIKFDNEKIDEFLYQDFEGELTQLQNDKNLRRIILYIKKRRRKKSLTIKQTEKEKNKILTNKLLYYVNNRIPIFQSIEEFLNCFTDVQNRILKLMNQYEKCSKRIKELKITYDSIINDGNKYKSFLRNILNEKEKEFNFILNKYNKNKNIMFSLIEKKKSTITEKKKEKMNNSKNKNPDIDLDMVLFIKYDNLIKKYNYEYTLLLNILIDFIQKFIKLNYNNYSKENIFQLITKHVYNNIINGRNCLDENYRISIPEYIIKLLKVYENICELVLEKDKNYKIISLNSNCKFIYDIYQRERNRKNTEQIKDLIQKKKEEMKINVYNKTIKSVYIPRKKIPEKYNPKQFQLTKMLKNHSQDFQETQKKETEFQSFISYE